MAHTYTHLLTDAMFSTKDRPPMVRPELKSNLDAYLGGIITNLKGKPVLTSGPQDHVHGWNLMRASWFEERSLSPLPGLGR